MTTYLPSITTQDDNTFNNEAIKFMVGYVSRQEDTSIQRFGNLKKATINFCLCGWLGLLSFNQCRNTVTLGEEKSLRNFFFTNYFRRQPPDDVIQAFIPAMLVKYEETSTIFIFAEDLEDTVSLDVNKSLA